MQRIAVAGPPQSAGAALCQTIPITILSDAGLEGPEPFEVSLSSPSGGASLGTPRTVTVTIVDNEAVIGFAQGFATVDETAPTATLTVLRSGPLTGSASVQVRTIEGVGGGSAVPNVDYRPVPLTTLTFGPGVASQKVTVPILTDTAIDGPRTVAVALSNASGAALGITQRTANVIITDNALGGVFAFASAQFFASETAGVATLRVVRSMPNVLPRPPGAFLGAGVTVDFVVTGGTATNGADFTLATGRITFGANETFKDIVIPLVADGVAEGPESVVVKLQNPSGGFSSGLGLISTATLTIVD